MQRSEMEVRLVYYGDKKEYMGKEENCNNKMLLVRGGYPLCLGSLSSHCQWCQMT